MELGMIAQHLGVKQRDSACCTEGTQPVVFLEGWEKMRKGQKHRETERQTDKLGVVSYRASSGLFTLSPCTPVLADVWARPVSQEGRVFSQTHLSPVYNTLYPY